MGLSSIRTSKSGSPPSSYGVAVVDTVLVCVTLAAVSHASTASASADGSSSMSPHWSPKSSSSGTSEFAADDAILRAEGLGTTGAEGRCGAAAGLELPLRPGVEDDLMSGGVVTPFDCISPEAVDSLFVKLEIAHPRSCAPAAPVILAALGWGELTLVDVSLCDAEVLSGSV